MKKTYQYFALSVLLYGCSCRIDPRGDCINHTRVTIKSHTTGQILIGGAKNAVFNIDTMITLNNHYSGIGSYVAFDSTFSISLYERDTIATFKLNHEDTDTIEYKIRAEAHTVNKGERCERSYTCFIPYEFKYNGKNENVDSMYLESKQLVIVFYK